MVERLNCLDQLLGVIFSSTDCFSLEQEVVQDLVAAVRQHVPLRLACHSRWHLGFTWLLWSQRTWLIFLFQRMHELWNHARLVRNIWIFLVFWNTALDDFWPFKSSWLSLIWWFFLGGIKNVCLAHGWDTNISLIITRVVLGSYVFFRIFVILHHHWFSFNLKKLLVLS